MTYKFYDFFSGGGMVNYGLGPDWTCVFANDIDTKKEATYRDNLDGGKELVVKDIADVAISEIPGHADLAWASFPCQDLSLAGSGEGLNGGRSGTFWAFWRLIQDLGLAGRRPRLVVLENVFGALTSHGGKDFAAIGKALASDGYTFGAAMIDAIEFVPQSRPRLFVIAVAPDMAVPVNLIADGPDPKWHPEALLRAQALLPKRAASQWLWWKLRSPPERNITFSDLIEDEPKGVEWHSKKQTKYILSLMSGRNRNKVDAALAAKKRTIGAVYRRTRPDGNGGRVQRAEVRFDDVSGCLRTPRGGSSRQIILVVEGNTVRSRLLSPREAARLMGLPDEYRLPENYNAAYHIAGDGVVVPVVRYLANTVFGPVLEANNRNASTKAA